MELHLNQGAACRHDFKNKNFGWHPADKRKAAAKRKKCGTYRSESSYAREDHCDPRGRLPKGVGERDRPLKVRR